jgi:hypothetical protein
VRFANQEQLLRVAKNEALERRDLCGGPVPAGTGAGRGRGAARCVDASVEGEDRPTYEPSCAVNPLVDSARDRRVRRTGTFEFRQPTAGRRRDASERLVGGTRGLAVARSASHAGTGAASAAASAIATIFVRRTECGSARARHVA